MNTIAIQSAGPEDLAYIKEKIRKYLLDDTDIQLEHFCVAKKKGKTIGFGRLLDHGDFFELASLGVDYYYRKKGIGTQLTQFFIDAVRNQQADKPMYLVTHVPEYFNRFGFREVKAYPHYLRKKRNACRLDRSKITIMRFVENWQVG